MKKVLFVSAALLAFAVSANAQHVQEVQEEFQYNQYGQKVQSVPVDARLQDGILVFQSKQANYKMWFDVRVQGDAAVFFWLRQESCQHRKRYEHSSFPFCHQGTA